MPVGLLIEPASFDQRQVVAFQAGLVSFADQPQVQFAGWPRPLAELAAHSFLAFVTALLGSAHWLVVPQTSLPTMTAFLFERQVVEHLEPRQGFVALFEAPLAGWP